RKERIIVRIANIYRIIGENIGVKTRWLKCYIFTITLKVCIRIVVMNSNWHIHTTIVLTVRRKSDFPTMVLNNRLAAGQDRFPIGEFAIGVRSALPG
ncbi:MAG: hypothetical protein AAFY83_11670, partial [Pseudomonadota bacterium]